MLLPYYITTSIPEPSTIFSVSYNCVTYDCNRCHASITHNITSHPLPKSKMKKGKWERDNKIKPSLMFITLTTTL